MRRASSENDTVATKRPAAGEPALPGPMEMDAWAPEPKGRRGRAAAAVQAACTALAGLGFWRFGFDAGAAWALLFGAVFVVAALWVATRVEG